MGFCFFQNLLATASKPMNTEPEQSTSLESPRNLPPSRWLIVAAFAAIYVVWGSTYLGIRFAIESIPPFFMAGSRSLVAGLVLFLFASRGQSFPTLRQWRDAFIVGGLMLTIGNGGVSWAERFIPSGVAALIVALVPLWMVIIDWLRPNGIRPRSRVIVGLVVGFIGVACLTQGKTDGAAHLHVGGVIVLMFSSLCWAAGSIFSRHSSRPKSLLLSVGMQMIAGGSLLLLTGLIANETETFSLARVTSTSALAWLYLTVMGSLVGFTAYGFLLRVSTPAKVATSGYVNPLIAVLLGCTIGNEVFSREIFLAGSLIIVAVALIVTAGVSASNSWPARLLRPLLPARFARED